MSTVGPAGPPAGGRSTPRRRGLVLGAGGLLGFTWTVGALYALERALDIDVRDMDVVLGTSGGSVMAAVLACGVPVDVVMRHQHGRVRAGDTDIGWNYDADAGGALPPLPGFGPGSPRLLAEVARHPRRFPVITAATALLPRGRRSLAPVTRMIDRIGAGRDWPERETWIVALDYARGRRTVFGQVGAPATRLAEAVGASCAIPGWYAPAQIQGRVYIDGGAWSETSLDLLAGSGLDEVYVVAPMAAHGYDRPWSLPGQVERGYRRGVTRRLRRETATVRASGTEVYAVVPGPADLKAIGANMMDPRRRRAVLRTSVATSTAALRHLRAEESA